MISKIYLQQEERHQIHFQKNDIAVALCFWRKAEEHVKEKNDMHDKNCST